MVTVICFPHAILVLTAQPSPPPRKAESPVVRRRNAYARGLPEEHSALS